MKGHDILGETLGFLWSSLGFQTVSIKIAAHVNVLYYSLVTEMLFPNIHLAERFLLLHGFKPFLGHESGHIFLSISLAQLPPVAKP